MSGRFRGRFELPKAVCLGKRTANFSPMRPTPKSKFLSLQFVNPVLSEEMKNNIAIPAEVMPGYHIGTMMVKRRVFGDVGPFTEDLEVGEFIDWFARAKDSGCRVEMLPEVVMERRIHETIQGMYKRDKRSDYAHLIKGVLDRRRKIKIS